MKRIGSTRLPCGHKRVRLDEHFEPQPRRCAICKRKYLARLVPAETASRMTDAPIHRIEFEEVQ